MEEKDDGGIVDSLEMDVVEVVVMVVVEWS